VYAWDAGRVVKLFRRDFPREAIEVELHHARIAHGLGLPTPSVAGLIELDGRTGIVFERCDGPTLYELIQSRARDLGELASVFYDLQQAIHRCQAPGLQPLQARLVRRIAYARGVPESLKNEAIGLVQAAPVGNAVCHGDFHPINVLMTAGRPVVIDWLDAARGDPAIDVTRSLLYLKYARPRQVDHDARTAFLEAYVDRCRQAWAGRMEQLERWQFPVAVARLSEAVEDAERASLMKLIERADSLWR